MQQPHKTISIIIPTHNRRALLCKVLAALATQTFPAPEMEVIVVADGCADDTLTVVQSFAEVFDLVVLSLPGLGVAAARNHGVSHARGDLILFIDDDVLPMPELVAAHVAAHQSSPQTVAIGPYPMAHRSGIDWFAQELRSWWSDYFAAMQQPGHRFSYRDVLTGNLSMARSHFATVGGFNPRLRRHQDYDLGVRLIAIGTVIRYVPEALAIHNAPSSLSQLCANQRREGAIDVEFLQLHPQLRQDFPLAYYGCIDPPAGPLRPLLRRLAFQLPLAGDRLVAVCRWHVRALERLRMRERWRNWSADVRDYWYWRGVAEVVGSPQALDDLLQAAGRSSVAARIITLDLHEGIAAAEQRLDRERPDGAELRYGVHAVGTMPARAGAEPLRGAHLRPFLRDWVAWPLLQALAADRAGSVEAAAELPYFLLEANHA